MIEGLEILKQKEIYDIIWQLLVGEILFGILSMFLILKFKKKNTNRWLSIVGILTIVFEITIMAIKIVPTGEYQYTVKVSQEASALEIYENYDIVSQNGAVWVITEK